MGQWDKILVGVDGSPASRKALGWASDEAVRHGSELVLLTAYLAPPPPPSSGTLSPHEATRSSEAANETAKALLMEAVREVIGEDRVAFNEACEYPDGTRVLAATTLELQDGKIVQQVNVEAWDE